MKNYGKYEQFEYNKLNQALNQKYLSKNSQLLKQYNNTD